MLGIKSTAIYSLLFIAVNGLGVTVVVANLLEDLGTMLEDLNGISQQVILKMNRDKTKIMSSSCEVTTAVCVGNSDLEVVNEYVYLGEVIQLDILQGSSNDEFDYPCGEQANISCIRNYFVGTGRCNEVTQEDGQPIPLKTLIRTYVPTVKLRATSESDVITFSGSKITAFYVNRQTNNLVFSVNFDGINKNSTLTTFIVSQRGREPAVESTYLNETYSSELTAIIPSRGESGLEGTTVTVINNNPIIPFDVGPELALSKEPAIRAMFVGLVANIPSALEQLLLTKGPYFFYTYLQNYICDFGVVFNGEIV